MAAKNQDPEHAEEPQHGMYLDNMLTWRSDRRFTVALYHQVIRYASVHTCMHLRGILVGLVSGQIPLTVLLLNISCTSTLGGFDLDNRSGLHAGTIAVAFPLSAQPRNSQNLCDAESGRETSGASGTVPFGYSGRTQAMESM
jgi:hypothetical protein